MKILNPLFLMLFLLIQTNSASAVNSETISLLEKVVLLGNQKTPIQLTPTLTMEKLSTKDGQLTYHYKSTYSDTKDFNLARFVKDRTEELTKQICTNASQQIFRERKVILNYEYLDKNDVLLTIISIKAGECK
ncbi:hypothetical protein KJY73_07965 [Bowmanella sp. Y26]|uniref:hypothetical protein n=1 Tax=Bowmanella yangjiangensis TaxID=2811230 RepID=UPI001BDCC0F4|nr:hypothetical protein [Bowmanella yangjiangensis]MBT1063506.1 hypothetical protein [Bowmanella yangjiangensis]